MGCYLLMGDKMFRSVLLVLFFLHENLGVTILKKYIYFFNRAVDIDATRFEGRETFEFLDENSIQISRQYLIFHT